MGLKKTQRTLVTHWKTIGSARVTVNYRAEVRADTRVTNLAQPVTVEVLENDSGDLDNATVEIELPTGFMETNPSAVLSEDGKRLVVPGQGTWTVNGDGTITYRVETGTEIVDPTPISYSVEVTNGERLEADATIVLNQSVVAEATDTEEDCETYEESSISLYSDWSLLLVILFGTAFGVFFFRREKF